MRLHPSTERAVRLYHRQGMAPAWIAARVRVQESSVRRVLGELVALHVTLVPLPEDMAARLVVRRRKRCAWCGVLSHGHVRDTDGDWCCAPGSGCAKGA